MDDFVPVEVVATEAEAVMLCALLQSAGIDCTYRVTNRGAGAADGLAVGGPQEVIVRSEDVETAREVMKR
jgi:Putative prokaryotic signal transducing protein